MSETTRTVEGEVVRDAPAAEAAPPKPNGIRALARARQPRETPAAIETFGRARADDTIARATEVATALSRVIEDRGLFKMIRDKKHVLVEGWTTLGALMGVMAHVEWSRVIPPPDGARLRPGHRAWGFEARVSVRTLDGREVSAAEAECSRGEKTWGDRDDFALRSMSETRATGKAMQTGFRWVMVLAGYQPDPAENYQPESDDRVRDARESPEEARRRPNGNGRKPRAVPTGPPNKQSSSTSPAGSRSSTPAATPTPPASRDAAAASAPVAEPGTAGDSSSAPQAPDAVVAAARAALQTIGEMEAKPATVLAALEEWGARFNPAIAKLPLKLKAAVTEEARGAFQAMLLARAGAFENAIEAENSRRKHDKAIRFAAGGHGGRRWLASFEKACAAVFELAPSDDPLSDDDAPPPF